MENNTPQLLTMPLRFRVWSQSGHSFMTIADAYPLVQMSKEEASRIDFSLQELSDLLEEITYYDGNDNYIVSQDTGLKDRNGKGIYTGDIVKVLGSFSTPQVFVVSYSIERGYARIYPFYPEADDDLIPGTNEAEVIGKIWQNPELLEGECCE